MADIEKLVLKGDNASVDISSATAARLAEIESLLKGVASINIDAPVFSQETYFLDIFMGEAIESLKCSGNVYLIIQDFAQGTMVLDLSSYGTSGFLRRRPAIRSGRAVRLLHGWGLWHTRSSGGGIHWYCNFIFEDRGVASHDIIL